MNIGIVSSNGYEIRGQRPQWTCYSFLIAAAEPSFNRIFDSAFATPARYVHEIYRRVRAASADGDSPVLVFNPLFDLSALELWIALDAVRNLRSMAATIISDGANAPIAYLLPPRCVGQRHEYLRLLSTVDAELDCELCSRLFECDASRIVVNEISAARAGNNGFHLDENRRIYKWIGERALATIRELGRDPVEGVPFAAIMPHHAGDALFFALAWKRTSSPVRALVVNQSYRSIVDDNAAALAVIPLDETPINRGSEFLAGKVTSEAAYFWTYQAALAPNYFYLYLRPSRDYNVTRYHLLDHFAFALGASVLRASELIANEQSDEPDSRISPLTPDGKKANVLLCFDGGQRLKIYPEYEQNRLIGLLKARGYCVTVLAPKGQCYPECQVKNFESYFQLKELMATQHLVVGMDSFPTHLAAHVLHLPTVCLFGSTRPENASVPVSPSYRSLERGLKCRPCSGLGTCPLYGGRYCRNFVSPETVLEAIEATLNGAPVRDAEEPIASRPLAERANKRIHHIDFRFSAAKRLLYACVVRRTPRLKMLRLLSSEFAHSIERDGLRSSLIRTVLFVRKAIVGRR